MPPPRPPTVDPATRTGADAPSEWPGEWLRGVLAVCVLHLLHDGPTYGYALAQRLEENGLGTVKGGTLYPLLGRLEDAGLVDVDWRPGTSGPGRKYFALTALGRDAAREQAHAWCAFAQLTTTLLTDSSVAATPAPPGGTPC